MTEEYHKPARRRIALVVGDTPGHFYPALAVAEAYRRFDPAAVIQFFGPAAGVATSLAAEHGCTYQPVSSSPLARVGVLGKVAAVPRTLRGVLGARRALRGAATRLVIGFGSYASGPVVLAARTLNLRTAVHEGNARPGLANRWLGRLADRVYVNFDAAARSFPRDRQLAVGWPVRQVVNVLANVPCRRPPIDRPARILVMAQGRAGDTPFLNSHAPGAIGQLAGRGASVEVRHQAHAADAAPVAAEYARLGVPATVGPVLDSIDGAYQWSDFVIARAGAGTIAELAIARLPALLVPRSDAADDHQAVNARAFAEAGGGFWTREEDWNREAIASRVGALLASPAAWQAASEGSHRLAKPDAAAHVVADCEAIMQGRW